MDEFNSQKWISDIKGLAREYYECADKQLVSHKELFVDSAIKEYSERRKRLKREIFGDECPADKRIDRHKTIALYIQVFLEKPIFTVPDTVMSTNGLSPKSNLINESFCYDFMCIVLEEWTNKSVDHKKLEEYRAAFLRLLRYYRKYSKQDNMSRYQTDSVFDMRVNYFTYTLANVIYFIERDFMA
jgi:hypothetical protein